MVQESNIRETEMFFMGNGKTISLLGKGGHTLLSQLSSHIVMAIMLIPSKRDIQ